MPELPEVEVLSRNLKKRLLGVVVEDVSIIIPNIIRCVKKPFNGLIGRVFNGFERRGKYILFDLDGLFLVYNGGVSCVLELRDLPTRDAYLYLKTVKGLLIFSGVPAKGRSVLYLTDRPESLPFIRGLGVDALSVDFSPDYIKRGLRSRRDWIFNALIDQGFVSGIGPAYANEILFEARISPFKQGRGLADEEIERLHYSTRIVLKGAIETIEGLYGDALEIRERMDFLKVYRRKDRPCPVCGEVLQWNAHKDYAIYYCPQCQGVE